MDSDHQQPPPNRLHCFFCFDVLSSHLTTPSTDTTLQPPFPDSSYPLFVSWHDNNRLRGCIGNFSPQPLNEGLRDYALISATQDTRFHPITARELPRLECSVSLLTDFEPIGHWRDWEVGKHGVRIRFKDTEDGRFKSATYLPEVAREQQWDQTETLRSLLWKGGYKGSQFDVVLDGAEVTRYQSRKCQVHYEVYAEWKQKGLY